MAKLWIALALTITTAVSFAQELDPVAKNAPKGLLVRVDQSGNRVVFKSDLAADVVSVDQAEKAIAETAHEQNQIHHLELKKGELDRSTSQEAWYYWYNRYNYGYGYRYHYNYYYYANWYGNYYSYYSYYNYYWRGYNWYYYRW